MALRKLDLTLQSRQGIWCRAMCPFKRLNGLAMSDFQPADACRLSRYRAPYSKLLSGVSGSTPSGGKRYEGH